MVLAALPLFAGYFLILLRDDRRGLHDLLAAQHRVLRRAKATAAAVQPPWNEPRCPARS